MHSFLRKDIQGLKKIISLSHTAWVSAENVHSGEGTLLSYTSVFLTGSLQPFSHIPHNVPVCCCPSTPWAKDPKVVWSISDSMLPTAPSFFSHSPPPSVTPQRVHSESFLQSKVKLCWIQAFSCCAFLGWFRIMRMHSLIQKSVEENTWALILNSNVKTLLPTDAHCFSSEDFLKNHDFYLQLNPAILYFN